MLKPMVALVAAVLVLAVPVGSASAATPNRDIVETAAVAPQFSTLVSLVKKAGLVGTLSGKARYTVFAPTNAAFAKVPKKTLDALLDDRALLRKVLLYHVLPGSVPASTVVKTESAKTAAGPRVEFAVRGRSAFVNDARITRTDIRCSNGIVHSIDAVLIPPAG
jgi:uncharacterized surface protein with fasciclin (FAS1) repeats